MAHSDRRVPRRGVLAPLRAAVRVLLTISFTLVDRCVPKRADRVLLGCEDGLRYTGNPPLLFEHLIAAGGWDAYWVTASEQVYRQVSARYPGRVLRAGSLRSLRLGLSARYFFVSHSPGDVGRLRYSRLPRVIQMTHGAGPKTMGYAKRHHDPASVRRAARLYAHVICSSPFEATFWERAYAVPRAAIWATGVPRNDVLLRPADPALAHAHPLLRGTVVLYAPTFREGAVLSDYLPIPGMDPEPLVQLLARYDATLLVRPHYYESEAARATIARVDSPRIQVGDDSVFPDTNTLLPYVDVLVTDYSSIYTDYLLLDRPIVFNPVDLEQYDAERGFFFDYSCDVHTPGAKVRTADEFLTALEAELAGADPYRDVRTASRQLFHSHPEGGAAQRIAAQLRAATTGSDHGRLAVR